MLGTTVPNRKIAPETRGHERCQDLECAGAGLEPVLEQLTKGQAMCSCGAWHLKAKLCCQSWTDSKKGLPRRASVCQGMPRYAKICQAAQRLFGFHPDHAQSEQAHLPSRCTTAVCGFRPRAQART